MKAGGWRRQEQRWKDIGWEGVHSVASPSTGACRLLWRAVGLHFWCGRIALHYACHIEPNRYVIKVNQIFIGTHFAGGHRPTPVGATGTHQSQQILRVYGKKHTHRRFSSAWKTWIQRAMGSVGVPRHATLQCKWQWFSDFQNCTQKSEEKNNSL